MDAGGADRAATRSRRPAAPVSDLILPGKVTAPGVPDWAVPRPRITKLIVESIRWHTLTVVTGPAGAGKTMALAMWAKAEPGALAWVCLDESDNRPAVFWPCIVAALRCCGVALPAKVRAAARERPGGDEFLLRLTAALACQDPPVTLVLDDLHVLTEPRVLKGLDFVLRNVGPGLRMVVTSRMDPLLPLYRYRLVGTMAEIRAGDLAFSTAEAGQLLARHGTALAPDLLESLARRTEGWAAGLRLAAISLRTHPDPGQFVKELLTDDKALTDYVVDEVLDVQPPEIRDVLLCTSILDDVSADAAVELTGDEQAAEHLRTLVSANTFLRPTGGGWYRYQTLFAAVLRLKLRHDDPERMVTLHRRAARWCERHGQLANAVRHGIDAGDWPLAASIVVDGLAVGELVEPGEGRSLADEFGKMPSSLPWTAPQPPLVSAAVALSAGRHESCAAALDAADAMLERLPGNEQTACRLSAAAIRATVCLRTGDLTAAASAAACAQLLLSRIPEGELASHSGIQRWVSSARGALELWCGNLDEAAHLLEAAAGSASGPECDPVGWAGHLALAEILRGRLGRAAQLAARSPKPAALVADALVHVERNELGEARGCLKQADAALGTGPDKPLAAVAYMVAAAGALAEGRAGVAGELVARARSGWPVPAWLDQRLSLLESQAYAVAGNIQAALAAARRVGATDAPEAAVALAHAWAAAGDGAKARHALVPALGARDGTPDQVRVQAWLADARLGYASGDHARGRRSLAAAMRLAEREQLRLPFALEHSWIEPVLRHDPELADAHRRLLNPERPHERRPAPVRALDQGPVVIVEQLTEREREVLRNASDMLDTAEIAQEMYITVNTVKSHLKNIYRKLATTDRGQAVRRARQLQLI